MKRSYFPSDKHLDKLPLDNCRILQEIWWEDFNKYETFRPIFMQMNESLTFNNSLVTF